MIYFLQDSLTLDIKIGFAVNPDVRLATLQTGNPSRLVLIATLSGERSDEARLHRQFAKLCVRGEWFRSAPELFLHITIGIREEARSRVEEQFYRIPDMDESGETYFADLNIPW